MTKLLRRIKLSSIRRNPQAGQTAFYMPAGPVSVTEVWDHGDCVVMKQNGIEVSCKSTGGKPHRPKMTERKEERPVQVVRTIEPAPDFFYGWEPMEVECVACHEVFDYGDLKDGSSDDFDGSYSDKVCPHCGEWDCLREPVEEETMAHALARLKRSDPERHRRITCR